MKKVYERIINPYKHNGGSRGIRTLDPLIKSQMLYLLSQRTKYGCLGWVRTSGMSESKSDALPLGYEAILKWWGDMDSNHGTRRNRFLYYYSFHYQLPVCSLDFLLTISFDLGPSYKVSTLKVYPLARDWHILILSFPRISDVHYNYFQLQVQFRFEIY